MRTLQVTIAGPKGAGKSLLVSLMRRYLSGTFGTFVYIRSEDEGEIPDPSLVAATMKNELRNRPAIMVCKECTRGRELRDASPASGEKCELCGKRCVTSPEDGWSYITEPGLLVDINTTDKFFRLLETGAGTGEGRTGTIVQELVPVDKPEGILPLTPGPDGKLGVHVPKNPDGIRTVHIGKVSPARHVLPTVWFPIATMPTDRQVIVGMWLPDAPDVWHSTICPCPTTQERAVEMGFTHWSEAPQPPAKEK